MRAVDDEIAAPAGGPILPATDIAQTAVAGRDRGEMSRYLEIDRLSKQFSAHGRAACKDISFEVKQKEFVALLAAVIPRMAGTLKH